MSKLEDSNKTPEIASAAKRTGPQEDPIINGTRYHYTRIAIETEVWHAMKYKKLFGNESFTEQINNGMRLYLKEDIPRSKYHDNKTKEPNQ